MHISYNWLKQFINIDWSAQKTGELLTDLGLEVEGISPFQSIKGALQGIVVGHVISCNDHPNADRLKLTTVDLGSGDPVQIVCGAPNVAQGQKVPVATAGTTLYDTNGKSWTITKGNIRGEVSNGMICAEDEIGLGKSHDGIMILDPELKPGTPLAQLYKIENDQIFEIGLTPNRADAMSHMGVARDIRAGMIQLKLITEFMTPSVSAFRVENRTRKISVAVLDHELAPRYCGVTLSELTIQESPDWLKNRLKAIGLSPKNNVVDVTNYVMHELGQPLHAFDLSRIKGGEINIKTVKKGTQFKTLDGIKRTLNEEDLMICDAEKPLCIAGVFGGEKSGVTQTTTSIFLESAFFDPISVRKTAKRHGLNTDASFRFERGIDANITKYALKRAVLLIQEIAGGIVTSDIVDIYPKKVEDHQVVLNFERAHKLIGEEIPKETIKSILSSLDIKINNVTETGIGMTIPAYRNDVTREVDVIEEILRVYGYNNIKIGQKLNASIAGSSRFEDHKIRAIIGDQLAAGGFYEIMGNSLTSPKYNKLSTDFLPENAVKMLNPLSSDLSIMRQTLLFSGLEALAHNLNRKREDLRLFEFGKSYHQLEAKTEERKHLSLFCTGDRQAENWTSAQKQIGFFYLKGIVKSVLERLGISQIKEEPLDDDLMGEAVQFCINGEQIVFMGTIKDAISSYFDIQQEVLYADFNWDRILTLIIRESTLFKSIPKYPSIARDFALLLDNKVRFSQIYDLAKDQGKELLKEISLFDVYQGKNLPEGKKSYAVRFVFQDTEKTLTDKQIDKTMERLQNTFESKLGASLR